MKKSVVKNSYLLDPEKKVKFGSGKNFCNIMRSHLYGNRKKYFTWHLYGLTPEWDRLCLARGQINLLIN
jgi:hypothetical protein